MITSPNENLKPGLSVRESFPQMVRFFLDWNIDPKHKVLMGPGMIRVGCSIFFALCVSGLRRGCMAKFLRNFHMAQGTVKWFNAEKGFGFIAPADGSADVFVHYTEIKGNGFRALEENQQVEFVIGEGAKGPQAQDVRAL